MGKTNMTKEKPDIYIYKLVCDDGGAPCICYGKISLCICKPMIRRTAKEGDWIIGVGGKKIGGKLIYIMRVGEVIDGKDYYSPKRRNYWKRPDCIYEWTGKEYRWRKGARYHSQEHLNHDLGDPEKGCKRAICLVGDCFAYFGDSSKETQIEKIEDVYEKLRQGHRKNYEAKDYGRLNNYINEILYKYGCGSHGNPIHLNKSGECSKVENNAPMKCSQNENNPTTPCRN